MQTHRHSNILGDKRGEGLAKECLCLTFGEDPQREGVRKQLRMSLDMDVKKGNQ